MIAAQHLKDLREEKNYTQEYLATELDISQKTYSNMENGKSRIFLHQILKLAEVYKMNPVALTERLFETSPSDIKRIEKNHPEASSYEINHGINSHLPFEYIAELKQTVDELRELNAYKEKKIQELKKQLQNQ
jgi:transcriptional regulator with XRE-family HTH domain